MSKFAVTVVLDIEALDEHHAEMITQDFLEECFVSKPISRSMIVDTCEYEDD